MIKYIRKSVDNSSNTLQRVEKRLRLTNYA